MGMTDEMFWRSTPAQFTLRVEAYKRHNRADAMYFRETFALLYNINRGEKSEALEGKDILMLHGEKLPRQPRGSKRNFSAMSAKELQGWVDRVNSSHRREVADGALFGIETQQFILERGRGTITEGMILKAREMADGVDTVDKDLLDRISAATGYRSHQTIANAMIRPPFTPPVSTPEAVAAVSEGELQPVQNATPNETVPEMTPFVPPGLTGEPIII